MFDHYWRPSVRKLLLSLLHWTEKNPAATVVYRGERKFWQREIHFSPLLVAALSVAAFFLILLLEIGLSWYKLLGLVIFILMLTVFIVMYLKDQEPELLADSETMMLLGLLFIGAALFMQISRWLSPLAMPVTAFTLLAGLLLSRGLALLVGMVLSLFVGVLNDFSLEVFLVHSFVSLAAVASLPGVRNRSDITRLGVRLAVAYMAVILVIHLFFLWPIWTLGVNLLWGALGGFSSALIVLGTLPYLESFFSRTTNIKLLELADFNQPLLKRLMIEAPGTYHHSLITASLAEQAAESIGANSLLARISAYYHDIGKLSTPEYFIENQQAKMNPHDPLTPTMSSLVVISHVKEGKALAQAANIDKSIINCIEQHHGTSLIHYFYHRALEQNPEARTDNFRYPGPKPQTKVAAILMLADAVEAACRTIDEPSPGRLRDTVEKVINNKFTDGQFAECPITLRDLSTIAESMVTTLSSIYHARIDYPQDSDTEARRG